MVAGGQPYVYRIRGRWPTMKKQIGDIAMGKKRIIFWAAVVGALLFFLALGVQLGPSKAQAQLCASLKLAYCTGPDQPCSCGPGWKLLDGSQTETSPRWRTGAYNEIINRWMVAICYKYE